MNSPSLLASDLVLPILVVVSLALQLRIPIRARLPLSRDHVPGVLVAAAVAVAAALPGTVRPVALAQTAPATSVDVTITATGLQPASVTLASVGSVHWTNNSSQAQSITANDGLFDSGSLAPGAGFSIALAVR